MMSPRDKPLPREDIAPPSKARAAAEPPPRPVTLGDLIAEKKLMWTYCLDCCHERDLDPATIPLPPATPIPGLGRRHMKCSKCGSRKIDTRPELYKGGIAVNRIR